MPKISIIVPVYNTEKYIKDCLDSILNQSFKDFEILCINDGSTDRTLQILEKYKADDKRITVINQENRGQSAARNIGIDKAEGDYICFVDSDDMIVKDTLKILVDAIEKYNVDIVNYETAPLIYESDYVKEKNNKDEYYLVRNSYKSVVNGRALFTEMVENGDFVDSACLLFIKRQWLLNKSIFFCEGMLYEDAIFSIQCFFQCCRMKHIKDRLYQYRVRDNSTMTEKMLFKHQVSRIWQFSECLRIIYSLAKTEREVSALALYAGMCMRCAKYVNFKLDNDEKEKIKQLDSLYGLLAKTMDLNRISEQCNRELYLEGLLAIVKNAEHIILYGASIVGNKVKNYIAMNGMENKILGFATSHEIAPKLVDGLCVKSITEYMPREDLVVIISAGENHHTDMYNMAKKLGFEKIYVIDNVIESLIDEILE